MKKTANHIRSARSSSLTSGEAAETAIAISKEDNVIWDDAIKLAWESERKRDTSLPNCNPSLQPSQ